MHFQFLCPRRPAGTRAGSLVSYYVSLIKCTHIEPICYHKIGRTVNYDKYYADIANSTVKFDEKGDGLARYTIFNYQKKLEGAGYDYKVT
jgi:hypothetical protein